MKKLKSYRITAALIAASFVFTIAGCSTSAGTSATSSEGTSGTGTAAMTVSDSSATTGNMTASTTTVTSAADSAIDTSSLFTDRDLEQTADLADATYYTVSDGQGIQITEAGVYVISGTASDATITVETADDAKVQIVLDGVSVTNSDSPVIYVKSADKVFVTTTSGSDNTLTVTGTFSADGDTNTDAVIFSKDDLTLNGLGTLTIDSTDNGITCKDDLIITGGTYDITAAADAFEANDSIAIADGNFAVDSDKDAFHCENDEDDTVGYIYIADGTFDIDAGDDGIQGTTTVQIDGGSFDITSSEGIEGTFVQINDGTISIDASDDGINATAKSTAESVEIEINGGDITVVMGGGDTDALDANGSLYINGGTVDITASSPFDYDATGELNGGTVTVNGSAVTELTTQMMGGGMGGQMGGTGTTGQTGGYGGQMRG